jgi:hypothetical protein
MIALSFPLKSTVYSHKTVTAAALMIHDILAQADPYFRIAKDVPISRAMLSGTSYTELDDDILVAIYNSDKPGLENAKRLIKRYRSRDLYKLIGKKYIDPDDDRWCSLWQRAKHNELSIKQDFVAIGAKHQGKDGRPFGLDLEDFKVQALRNDHGKKHLDPTLFMRFLPKHESHKLCRPWDELPNASEIEDNSWLPEKKEKRFIRVFCKNEKKLDLLRHVYPLWEAEMDRELKNTELSNSNDEDDEPYAVPLTQEEEDDSLWTPQKGRAEPSEEDRSPIPTLRR